ncbi:MAG: biotin/lipoyl-binding protein, partial [Chloroflexota bacterium]|nr:biotin/lipoyl-binding protein [Chloroflexota bacterium]
MVVVLLILLAVLVACQAASSSGTPGGAWSGFLEGKTIDVSAQVGGRVTTVAVEEGERVNAGQMLLSIDDDFAKLRVQAADANVAAAQAQVALLEAGARSEDLRRAQARVDQARAALVAATQALSDTEAIRANPQALLIAQTDAKTRGAVAASALTAAARQAEATDLQNKFWENQVNTLEQGVDITLPSGATLHFDTPRSRIKFANEQWQKAGNDAWQAWAAVNAAQ